jgi:hypothetical protein
MIFNIPSLNQSSHLLFDFRERRRSTLVARSCIFLFRGDVNRNLLSNDRAGKCNEGIEPLISLRFLLLKSVTEHCLFGVNGVSIQTEL